MSLTKKTHERFWERMRANYGTRWSETYGDQPNRDWGSLLDRFSPENVGAALGGLSDHPHLRQHPPTLPQFEALLAAAQRAGRAAMTEADWRRGYWRASVIGGVMQAMDYRYAMAEFEPLMMANRDTLGRAMRDLLDELDALELATGQRTEGMQRRCIEGCLDIAHAYRAFWATPKPPQPATVEHVSDGDREQSSTSAAPF